MTARIIGLILAGSLLAACLFDRKSQDDSGGYSIDIKGKVLNKEGQPIPGAIARLVNSELADTTDETGAFAIRSKAPIGKAAKRSADTTLDHLVISRDAQVISRVGLTSLIDSLPTFFVVQRDIAGKLQVGADVGKVEAVVLDRGEGNRDPLVAELFYSKATSQYSGFIYFLYSTERQEYSVYINIYDHAGRFTGRSDTLDFNSLAGDIDMPQFHSRNAWPEAFAWADSVVSINDTIRLTGRSVGAFGGRIAKWEWKIGGADFVQASQGDTGIVAPAEAGDLILVLRVTDENSNADEDSVTVKVIRDVPSFTGVCPEIIAESSAKVSCVVSARQRFGRLGFVSDTVSGLDVGIESLTDTSVRFTLDLKDRSSLAPLRIRVSDDDGNSADTVIKVKIRPATLEILQIDADTNSLTVHFPGSKESDFAAYRIFRDTVEGADSSDSLWADLTDKGATQAKSKDEKHVFKRFSYTLYQVDSEGLWSLPSKPVAARILNTPPARPKLVQPADALDSIWAGGRLRWSSRDANGHPLRFRVMLSDSDGTAVSRELARELADSALNLPAFGGNEFKVKVMAFDSEGDSSAWSEESRLKLRGRTMVDGRDGKQYAITPIGGQTWMAQNLDFAPSSGQSWCYENQPSHCATTGRIYDWSTAVADSHGNGKDVCPAGWHLPSMEEWDILTDFIAGDGFGDNAALALKAKTGWLRSGLSSSKNGEDAYGFNLIPSGLRTPDGAFSAIDVITFLWTSTVNGEIPSWIYMEHEEDFVSKYTIQGSQFPKTYGFGVRCLETPAD